MRNNHDVMRQKITLTESQLRGYVERMVRESLHELMREDVLNEGKLARALGAAALGAGLMFGHPQDANAQLRNIRYVSEEPQEPRQPSGRISDNLSIHYGGLGRDKNVFGICLYCRVNDTGVSFQLGGGSEYYGLGGNAKQTLLDLEQLLLSRTNEVQVEDNNKRHPNKFRIVYDETKNALSISGTGTYFKENPNNSQKPFMYERPVTFYLTDHDIKKALQILDDYEQWETNYERWEQNHRAWENGKTQEPEASTITIDDVGGSTETPAPKPVVTEDPATEYQRLKLLLKNTQKELGNAKYNTYNVDYGFVRVKEQQVEAIKARMKELEAQMKQ